MNSKPTKAHLDFYVAHTIAALPDSLKSRKTILVVLHHLLPRESEQRHAVRTMLEMLNAHEAAQLKFQTILRADSEPS